MILEAFGIHKSYKTSLTERLEVLKGIDLEVKEGEMVCLVGPSGAGKSTLLHILGGLDKPDDGQVLLDGQNVYKLNDRKRAALRSAQIGFIFQFYHLLPELDALENVVLPMMIRDDLRQTKRLENLGKDVLEQVGLSDRMGHKPSQLSGGERQRVAIARALINQPKVLLCDEPTGNLDSENGRQVINLLKSFNTQNRQTIVMVTHSEEIAGLADRVIQLKDGARVGATLNQ